MPKLVVLSVWFKKRRMADGVWQMALSVFLFLYAIRYTLYASDVHAQGLTREECFRDSIAKLGCLPYYLSNIINGFFALSGIAAILLIMISGIRLLLSSGDPVGVAKARKSLYYSILGFVIVLASFLILKVISYITGAECINTLGFNTCS